jgi:protein SCO1/2
VKFVVTALALAVLACALPSAHAVQSDRILGEVGFDQKLDAQVALDLPFTDESGAEVELGRYFGTKPVVLLLVYYECPMLCTLVLNGFVRMLRALSLEPGDDFEIVTVSIDPRETPELAGRKRAKYIAEYGKPEAASGWHFLTGSEASIAKLASTVGFRFKFDAETNQYAHASGFVTLTPQGRVAKYFYGVEYAPRDVRLALVESSSGRIGTLVDQVLLLCYHYDPTTGKYGVAIMTIVRALGILTVGALVGFIVIMLRRERSVMRVHKEGA